MRLYFLIIGIALGWVWPKSAEAAEARILKVLPHYLDREARHALSPSLYERDAYQAHLREHPAEQSGLRFDIRWKASPGSNGQLKLRLELLSSGDTAQKTIVLESPVTPPRFFSKWTPLHLDGEEFKRFGKLIAWRATVWDGVKLLGEQKSFLW